MIIGRSISPSLRQQLHFSLITLMCCWILWGEGGNIVHSTVSIKNALKKVPNNMQKKYQEITNVLIHFYALLKSLSYISIRNVWHLQLHVVCTSYNSIYWWAGWNGCAGKKLCAYKLLPRLHFMSSGQHQLQNTCRMMLLSSTNCELLSWRGIGRGWWWEIIARQ